MSGRYPSWTNRDDTFGNAPLGKLPDGALPVGGAILAAETARRTQMVPAMVQAGRQMATQSASRVAATRAAALNAARYLAPRVLGLAGIAWGASILYYQWLLTKDAVTAHWDYGGWNVSIGPCGTGNPPTGFTPTGSGVGTCYTNQLFTISTITSTPPTAATTDHVKFVGVYPFAPSLGYYNRHTKLTWSGSGSRNVTWVPASDAVVNPLPTVPDSDIIHPWPAGVWNPASSWQPPLPVFTPARAGAMQPMPEQRETAQGVIPGWIPGQQSSPVEMPWDYPWVPDRYQPRVDPRALPGIPTRTFDASIPGSKGVVRPQSIPRATTANPGVHEVKVNPANFAAWRWTMWAVDNVTETQDLVRAIFKGLPKEVYKGQRVHAFDTLEQASLILANLEKMDWDAAVQEIIRNELEDQLIGMVNSSATQAAVGANMWEAWVILRDGIRKTQKKVDKLEQKDLW